MRIPFLLFCMILLSACDTAGPKYRPCIKYGKLCIKEKIYNYPDGKKLHLRTNVYRKDSLISSKLHYELWPNGEYKLISKNGFELYNNGIYAFNNPSVKIPDDLIIEYLDKNLESHFEVYQDGQRMPYLSGFANGTRVNIHTGEKPGIYIWKDAQLVFLREYTPEEKSRHEDAIKMINSPETKDSDIHFERQR